MIKVTNVRRNGDTRDVYINPRYIIRVGITTNSSQNTVIEVEGSQYDTWCSETVEQVMQLIEEAKGDGHQHSH